MYYDGIPLAKDYWSTTELATYKEMERWSASFLSENADFLKSYKRKWVSDPLHQWSRQWEYPYVYEHVCQLARDQKELKILDAGSGVTFFPYYLDQLTASLNLHCCDYDESLQGIYSKINSSSKGSVQYTRSDLRSLPYEDGFFDVIYCISVLEHTENYDEIIDQFYRVLKPGGSLLVTFDISLDGTRDISVDRATNLMSSLASRFDFNNNIQLQSDVLSPDIFTTHSAKSVDPNLLPWKAPSYVYLLHSLLTKGKLISWPPALTFCCVNLSKR